jgi:signal transduction histidine kinase/CheY-like chemotaxis protein
MYGVHAHGVVFLESEAEFVGLIYVDNLLTDNPISDEDMLGLLAFANQVVVAIQNARLIQKLQQVQETLVSTERLRAVGELASGVAHNVNNILAAVLGYAELVQEVPNLPPAAMQYAQTIEKAAMDGANIVRRIQHFARKHEQESRTILDVGEMVQEAIVLTRPLWHDQGAKVIELIADIQSGAFLLGVASEIREVVVNLLRNAVDAMPHGGTLNIECTVIGGMVRLRVKDSGAGMTEAVRKRLFEPFFTTKGVGLGTGLGLAIAWGIVDRHGGTIEVESELGRGATFTILLPFANDKVASPSPTLELSQVPGLHLLLVEDEEIVGQSLQEGLQKRGAKVTLVSTAQAALDYLQSTRNTVDVLLSDQGLPGMSGLELLQEVQRLYPHIHRLLISGWGANLQDMQTREVAQRVLAKPVKIETIVRALQEVTQRPVRRK